MRRLISILLLVLMLAASIAPAAVATVIAPTPACCRAGGRHHCSEMAVSTVPGGVRVEGQSCPYHKHSAFSGSAAPRATTRTVALADAQPFSNEFHPELFVSDRESIHSQRAPPPQQFSL